jgi:hypothetical protein
MAGYETVRQSELVRAIPELLANLSDLIQKELRLARAELAARHKAVSKRCVNSH